MLPLRVLCLRRLTVGRLDLFFIPTFFFSPSPLTSASPRMAFDFFFFFFFFFLLPSTGLTSASPRMAFDFFFPFLLPLVV